MKLTKNSALVHEVSLYLYICQFSMGPLEYYKQLINPNQIYQIILLLMLNLTRKCIVSTSHFYVFNVNFPIEQFKY